MSHGFPPVELERHRFEALTIDERGGNYYPLIEEQLRDGRTHHAPSLNPRGLAGVARDYALRLGVPLSLTETNIRGTVRDRISWLKYTLEQAESLAQSGVALRRFAWYPLFDCSGWNSLLQGKRWRRDPQGLFSCDPGWNRVSTELSELYGRVVRGAGSKDLPAYAFEPVHDRPLHALKQQMNWDWLAA